MSPRPFCGLAYPQISEKSRNKKGKRDKLSHEILVTENQNRQRRINAEQQELRAMYPGVWWRLRNDLESMIDRSYCNEPQNSPLCSEVLKNFLSPHLELAAKGSIWKLLDCKVNCPPMISPVAAHKLIRDYFSPDYRNAVAIFIAPFVQLSASEMYVRV